MGDENDSWLDGFDLWIVAIGGIIIGAAIVGGYVHANSEPVNEEEIKPLSSQSSYSVLNIDYVDTTGCYPPEYTYVTLRKDVYPTSISPQHYVTKHVGSDNYVGIVVDEHSDYFLSISRRGEFNYSREYGRIPRDYDRGLEVRVTHQTECEINQTKSGGDSS